MCTTSLQIIFFAAMLCFLLFPSNMCLLPGPYKAAFQDWEYSACLLDFCGWLKYHIFRTWCWSALISLELYFTYEKYEGILVTMCMCRICSTENSLSSTSYLSTVVINSSVNFSYRDTEQGPRPTSFDWNLLITVVLVPFMSKPEVDGTLFFDSASASPIKEY